MEGLTTSRQRRYALLRIRTAAGVSGVALLGLPSGAVRENQLRRRTQLPQDTLQRADQLALHDIQIGERRADDQRRVAGDMNSQPLNHPATLTTTAHPEFPLDRAGQGQPVVRRLGRCAAGVLLDVDRALTARHDDLPRVRSRDRPSLVTISSEGLDNPTWNAINPWLRLGKGDRPPYQLSGQIGEFCNAAGEGIDREQQPGRLGFWLGSPALAFFVRLMISATTPIWSRGGVGGGIACFPKNPLSPCHAR